MRLQRPRFPVVQGVQRRRQKRAEQGVPSRHTVQAQVTANVYIWYLMPHNTTPAAPADASYQGNHVEPHFSPANHTFPFTHPLLS